MDGRIGLVRALDPAGRQRITVSEREWEEMVRKDVSVRQKGRKEQFVLGGKEALARYTAQLAITLVFRASGMFMTVTHNGKCNA